MGYTVVQTGACLILIQLTFTVQKGPLREKLPLRMFFIKIVQMRTFVMFRIMQQFSWPSFDDFTLLSGTTFSKFTVKKTPILR